MMTPTMLTKEKFEASRRFIETSARPLEVASFHHAFEGGSDASVIEALKRYQNTDGGFGRALEPDLRAEESSVLCTSIGFQILRSLPAKCDEDLIVAAIDYLVRAFDGKESHWRIIPRSAERSPHAPWWNQAGREDEFDRFSFNPTAEILGYLYDYQLEANNDVLSAASDRVVSSLSGLEEIEMHELLCCLRLLQTKNLPQEIDQRIRPQLVQLIDRTVSYDPLQWKAYGLRPVQVVDHPASPFMAGREKSVATNLEYEISSQNEDGSWAPTWTWSDAFPDDWILACRDWTGVITLSKLLLLKDFNRIEGIG
jgi:hypothetical protein